jgi:TonB-linked SusC/RagA family outer membrane protein
VTAVALFESNDYASENLYAQRKDYLTTAIDQLFAGSEVGMRNSGSASEMGRSSYVGRLNYSYKNKYLFESILRADASAKFPEEKRWGYFPSMSLGWVISEEGFMKGPGWIDNLKLRASYGESGYDNIDNFAYLAGYKFDYLYIIDGATKQGLVSTGLANPNLTWENMKIYNAGIEYSFFNHKLYGEAEAFYRERDGIAFWDKKAVTRAESLPSTFGSALPPENLNSTNDRGFEFSAGTRGKLGDLSYDLSGNISWSRAKWNHYEEPEYTDPDQARIEKKSGQWIDRSFGYLTNGLFTNQEQIDNLGYDMDQRGNITLKPGDLWLLDVNDDKKVDWKDKVEVGKGTTPHWMVGFDVVLQYKQFDFAALFQGAFGYYTDIVLANMSDVKYENRWTPENNDPHALVPRLGGAPTNLNFSDFFYRNAGYLRMKTASLGYNLPKRWLDKTGFSQVRIYGAGVNLLTFSKLGKFGIDPESPSQGGRVGWYYPQQRTISCGVNISF